MMIAAKNLANLLGGPMQKPVKFFMILLLLTTWQVGFSQTLDEFINKAENFNRSGDFEQAAKVMAEAIQKFPDNSTAHSYLGLYRGMQAGQTQNYMEAGQLIETAYDMLNKAIALDPNNPIARFHRGLMGIKVPPFMGKLDEGIQDLEILAKLHQETPGKVPVDLMARAFDFLGEGYQKKQDKEKAIAAWNQVVTLTPGTDLAKNAEQRISELKQPQKVEQVDQVEQKKYTQQEVQQLEQKAKTDPDNPAILTQLGKAYIDTKQYEQAEKVLKKAIEKDARFVDAYKLLIETLGHLAEKGYDKRIYNDTDLRTKLAFEVADYAEKAVKIAPNDPELRLLRGSIGVMMPFFVGKLEQGIADLNFVTASDASREQKAEALYWLGYAHQKKATTYWIKVITDYSKTDASQLAFESMRPTIKHFDPASYKAPFLVIDFVLGFRDELPPQTAVWIEAKDGGFVKTVYVSGFSGFAKEKQANLSDWAKVSKFADADAVTSASIDVGHHIYVWDLKDYKGNQVKAGDFVARVEVAYWPSMEYQSVSANINIGKQNSKVVVEEGSVIPYLEVRYYASH
jgi:tetratricopeptide (TPR) repeat protein